MAEAGTERKGIDPFSPENAPAVNLIVNMRIYDALMALLQVTDEDSHDQLNKLHESGQVVWSLPWLDLKTSEDGSEGTQSVSVPATEQS